MPWPCASPSTGDHHPGVLETGGTTQAADQCTLIVVINYEHVVTYAKVSSSHCAVPFIT
uniref:Uncharacterized protein n=1 Tax=Setaria italica TaxID=4555 RepID=K4AP52_SETIT